jgi:hypothetical protein
MTEPTKDKEDDTKTIEDEPKDKEPKEQKEDEPVKVESINVKPKKNNCVKCIRCVWRTVLNTIQVIIDGIVCCCQCTKACIEVIDCDSDDE